MLHVPTKTLCRLTFIRHDDRYGTQAYTTVVRIPENSSVIENPSP